MDPAKAAKALLDGIASAVTDLKPSSLSLVRIVVLKQTVLAAFRSPITRRRALSTSQVTRLGLIQPVVCVCRSELERRLGQITPCRLSLAGLYHLEVGSSERKSTSRLIVRDSLRHILKNKKLNLHKEKSISEPLFDLLNSSFVFSTIKDHKQCLDVS